MDKCFLFSGNEIKYTSNWFIGFEIWGETNDLEMIK